jgi:hypothetical protein
MPACNSLKFAVANSSPRSPPLAWNPCGCFHDALAETVIRRCHEEVAQEPAHPEPWAIVDELKLATLSWVHCDKKLRLHRFIRDVLPAEFEETSYAGHTRWQKPQL